MSVTFEPISGSVGSGSGEGQSVTIQNPDLLDTLSVSRGQRVNFTADGQPNVYGLGATTRRIRLTWSNLRDDEKTALQTFFDEVSDGCINEFAYTDHRGAEHTARLLTPEIEWTQVEDEPVETPEAGSESGSGSGSGGGETLETTYQVGAATYPTTTRTGGAWSVSFELFLS